MLLRFLIILTAFLALALNVLSFLVIFRRGYVSDWAILIFSLSVVFMVIFLFLVRYVSGID